MIKIIQTSDWVLIAPHVYDWIKRKWFAPKLEIEFSHEPPYCHKEPNLKDPKVVVINKDTGLPSKSPEFSAYYCRFIVHNKGKSQAKLCEAILEELWIADSARVFHKDENFSPVNLNWVGFKGQPYININSDRRVFCDIGHVSSPAYQKRFELSHYAMISEEDQQKLKFFFDISPKYFAQRDSLVPGNYRIKVAIYSENAPKCEKMFQISWSGEWKEKEEEMFRELVIK